jgi:hypothetical protein
MKKLVLLIALFWAIANAFFALEPHLEVTALDSVAIPYEYDYVMQLPNGDLQFYKLNYGTSSIQFYGFQFLAQTNEVTPQADLGTVTDLNGLTTYRYYMVERFGNLYLVHKLTEDINVVTLDQSTYTSHTINEFTISEDFDFRRLTDIVAENAMAIAMPDSLIYYNFLSGEYQVLLQGASYQCSYELPIIIALPDSNFVYIKDSLSVYDQFPEVWEIFNSNGIHIGTNTSTDPDLLMNLVAKPTGVAPKKILGRWYLPVISSDERTCSYECSFTEPDSLHIYFFGRPFEMALEYAPFGHDRLVTLYYDELFESLLLYCNYIPIEQYPESIFSVNLGNYNSKVIAVSDEISILATRLPEQIVIRALWTNDFPVVHEFTFPVIDSPNTWLNVFGSNCLIILTDNKVYSFNVGISSPIDDAVSENIKQILQVYPNPIYPGQHITLSSLLKLTALIDIFDIKGRKVSTLEMANTKIINWNLCDEYGNRLSSGVYIAKLKGTKNVKPCKFVLLN